MTTPNEDLILKLRGQAYTTCRPDQLCDQAADLLQSQAERIKGLELDLDVQAGSIEAVQARELALNEAKLVAKTTCHHESTEFANGFNMAALNIESVIEALKGK